MLFHKIFFLYTMVSDYINIFNTTFKILIHVKLLNTKKHLNKEKLSIKKVSLYLLVDLLFEKSC